MRCVPENRKGAESRDSLQTFAHRGDSAVLRFQWEKLPSKRVVIKASGTGRTFQLANRTRFELDRCVCVFKGQVVQISKTIVASPSGGVFRFAVCIAPALLAGEEWLRSHGWKRSFSSTGTTGTHRHNHISATERHIPREHTEQHRSPYKRCNDATRRRFCLSAFAVFFFWCVCAVHHHRALVDWFAQTSSLRIAGGKNRKKNTATKAVSHFDCIQAGEDRRKRARRGRRKNNNKRLAPSEPRVIRCKSEANNKHTSSSSSSSSSTS